MNQHNLGGYVRVVRALACPSSIHDDASADAEAIARCLRLLDSDPVAATMVAASINTRQAAGESGPAFVKRIVRSWLEEMGR